MAQNSRLDFHSLFNAFDLRDLFVSYPDLSQKLFYYFRSDKILNSISEQYSTEQSFRDQNIKRGTNGKLLALTMDVIHD